MSDRYCKDCIWVRDLSSARYARCQHPTIMAMQSAARVDPNHRDYPFADQMRAWGQYCGFDGKFYQAHETIDHIPDVPMIAAPKAAPARSWIKRLFA